MTAKRYRLLNFWTCLGMFIVLIAGVVVTNTDSGRGCGTDWPLCNGKFVPAYTLESLIEYSHRAVSGLEGLLVAAVFVVTLLRKPRSGEAIFYASGSLAFTAAQAILGMMAVIWPTSDAVLAIHFGISMIAFTFTWLLYSWSRRMAAAGEMPGKAAAASAAGSVPAGIFRAVVAVLVYCYGVVYLGAYVRHTDSSGGCIGWPLCNGEVVPDLSGATGIVFAHRVAAALLFVFMLVLALYVNRRASGRRELSKMAFSSFVLVAAQVLSGWLVTETLDNEDAYVFTSLLHTLILTAMFSVLCLLAIRSWQLSRR
ncbi:COX15/CtaA family protein [Cohnella zeiphila]|uniref:Heme A synthase n=1 Tax=Cohnella zeiphila TaxID=2761120 RepID=A0A7X0VU87_9BACL|nr:COX15/CtaA family protein [Cohnella zeiphila]MBB6730746.1 heme A synthase [Cohnella zeiphila]